MKMQKKMFSMTNRHVGLLKEDAEKYQVSESETLRKMIDFYNDFYESVQKIKVERIEKND